MASRKMVQMNLFAGRSRDAEVENKLLDKPRERGWNELSSTDTYTHYHV